QARISFIFTASEVGGTPGFNRVTQRTPPSTTVLTVFPAQSMSGHRTGAINSLPHKPAIGRGLQCQLVAGKLEPPFQVLSNAVRQHVAFDVMSDDLFSFINLIGTEKGSEALDGSFYLLGRRLLRIARRQELPVAPHDLNGHKPVCIVDQP